MPRDVIGIIATIAICLALAAIVIYVIAKHFINKKKGQSSCGCGCSNCPSASFCHSSDSAPLDPAPSERSPKNINTL